MSSSITGHADVYKYANLFPSGITARRMWGIYLKTPKHVLRVLILNLLADGKYVMMTNGKYSTYYHCNN